LNSTAALLRPGDVLGGFRIDDVIGIGGMAIVYRAEQVSLGRPVALKVLSSKLTSDTVFRERFRREGTHAAALEHPNIVPVYDSGEQDGHLFIAMRLVDGTNLAELIQTRGLTADQTIEILRPIASALDTAHAAGLIHRDVKPQNILITGQGHPYLADFGVAKGSNTYGLTATGGFVGSVNYASPEQIKGLTLTPASDVYALTAVLYQCLTGHVPFPRETDAGVMHAHLHEPPPTLSTIAGADSDFHTVLARGMAKDAGARYGHAGDLMNAAALSVSRLPSKIRKSVPAFPGEATDGSFSPGEATDAGHAVTRASAAPANRTEVVSGDELASLRNAAAFTAADQRRPPAPEPEPEVAVTNRHWSLISGIGAAAALAIVAVVLLAGGSRAAHASAFRSGHLLLSSGKEWRSDSSSLSGLPLAAPISISAAGMQIYAGGVTNPDTIAGGVPASLVSSYGSPAQVSVIKLPLGLAKRYSWSSQRLAPLVLVVVATDAGEMAIACRAPTAGALARMLSACAGIAEKAKIVNTNVDYPGPDPQVARQIAQSLEPRLRIGAAAPPGLTAGRLPSRASALMQVASVDQGVASALTRIATAPRYRAAISSLAQALMREGDLARQIAGAATGGRRSLYESLRGGFVAISARLNAAAVGIAALGFAHPSVASLQIPRLPALHHRHVSRPRARSQSGGSAGATVPQAVSPAPETAQAPPTPTPTAPAYTPPPTPAPAKRRSEPQIVISKPE
jgi:serine/threonine protein kinase